MKRTLVGLSLLYFGAATLFPSCSSSSKKSGISTATGWEYNDPKLGGFDVPNYRGQQTGPGLTFVEGGRFTMGQTDEDLSFERNNIPRTVSVSSFYMDETEVANVHYREYIYWMSRAYVSDYPELITKALPDTTVWRKNLSYNEPLVQYYFRAAAYNFYPVVGVNWYQANEFAKWRSDRVNEQILMKGGRLKKNPNQVNEDVYKTVLMYPASMRVLQDTTASAILTRMVPASVMLPILTVCFFLTIAFQQKLNGNMQQLA